MKEYCVYWLEDGEPGDKPHSPFVPPPVPQRGKRPNGSTHSMEGYSMSKPKDS